MSYFRNWRSKHLQDNRILIVSLIKGKNERSRRRKKNKKRRRRRKKKKRSRGWQRQ